MRPGVLETREQGRSNHGVTEMVTRGRQLTTTVPPIESFGQA
jgi:hypothetical protein